MKLARLFLAVVAAGTLAACSDTVTAPDTKATDAPASTTTNCDQTYVDPATGQTRCFPTIGSGG